MAEDDTKPQSTLDKVLAAGQGEEEEDLIVRKFLQTFTEAAEGTKDRRAKIRKHKQLWDGDHFSDAEWGKDRSKVVINLLRSFVEITTAALTDNRPTIFVQPRMDGDLPLSSDLEHSVYYVLDDNDFDIFLPTVVRSTVMVGGELIKLIWNPFVRSGGEVGAIELHNVTLLDFYPDPKATTLKSARYCIEIRDLPYDVFLENFPERKDDIKPGLWDLEGHAEKYTAGKQGDGVIPTQTTTGQAWLMPFEKGEGGDKAKGSGQMIRFAEWFIREDQNHIRRVLLANGKVLENGPFAVKDLENEGQLVYFREYPYVLVPYLPTSFSFFPESLSDGLEGPQLYLDKIESYIQDHFKWATNSPWKYPKGALDNPIENSPASNVEYNVTGDGKNIPVREQPAQMGGEAFHHAETIVHYMEMLTGLVEVLQGRKPPGIEAAKAVQLMQEQANTRLRMHARYLEFALEKLGELIIDFIAAYWTQGKMIRLMGPQGQRTFRYIKGLQFRGHQFDVEVKAGSTLPFSREQLGKEALELYQAGCFGEPGTPDAAAEVLKVRQWPEWEKIIAKGQAEEEQMKEFQMAQAQAGNPVAQAQAQEQGQAVPQAAPPSQGAARPTPTLAPAR